MIRMYHTFSNWGNLKLEYMEIEKYNENNIDNMLM